MLGRNHKQSSGFYGPDADELERLRQLGDYPETDRRIPYPKNLTQPKQRPDQPGELPFLGSVSQGSLRVPVISQFAREVSMAQPEKTFRIGLVSASVFCNEVATGEDGETRMFRVASLQRRYRDGDVWKTSTSFGLSDLPNTIRVLELALKYIESIEAEA